jgi:gliding motility associated protien GldN
MKLKVLFFIYFTLLGCLMAQDLENDFSKKDSPLKENQWLEFVPTKKKDRAFSKVVWEILDKKEKKNKVFFFLENQKINPSNCLFTILLEGIKKGEIKAYEDHNLKEELNLDLLKKRVEKKVLTNQGKEIFNQGKSLSSKYYDHYEIGASEIKKIKIKGIWYFDKKISQIQYQIQALCLIGDDIHQISEGINPIDEVKLFWVDYFKARNLLDHDKTSLEINGLNISFEELLSTRKFVSEINFLEEDLENSNEALENLDKNKTQKIIKDIIKKAYFLED